VAAVLLVALVGWLGWRAQQAFDHSRHLAAARAVVSAPDVVTYRLPASGVGSRVSGMLQYRRGEWLSVVTLHGLSPVGGREHYLVFLHGFSGWTLAGAVRPNPDGSAQVRFGAEPRPSSTYEVVVTRGVDDATSIPHGTMLLHWFDVGLGPLRVKPFDPAHPVP